MCRVEGCSGKAKARGYCSKHYYKFMKWGNPLHSSYNDSWLQHEIEFLTENYSQENIPMICEKLGKSYNAVTAKASRLGLRSGRFLTDEEKEFIDDYSYLSNQKLCKRLGKNYNSIRGARHKYGSNLRDSHLCIADIAEITGANKSTISKNWGRIYGLRTKKIGRRYRTVSEKDLIEFCRTHPQLWDATKADDSFFMRFDWYKEKKKEDFERMVRKKWG